ncbi:hypothetical protein GZ78_15535 [Endozoicomonas numazuensis]|uniref:Uncharacterized protein n=1 Tax=Endozoicomonas numazuensis TaxID=1137799 RepID=A0A081NFL7_9GAMM|nr:hypothetical protein GZ78_15535 [Endozoicomonas numazuensis]
MWLPNREGTAKGRAREKSGVNTEGTSKRKSSKDILSVKPTIRSLRGEEIPESFIKGANDRKLGVLVEEYEEGDEMSESSKGSLTHSSASSTLVSQKVSSSNDGSVIRVQGERITLEYPANSDQLGLAQPYLPGEVAFQGGVAESAKESAVKMGRRSAGTSQPRIR